MGKTLIIVESPTKIKTLKKFLGKEFFFESSLGHIRDLPPKSFGIDVEHNFTPQYEILSGKEEVISHLKKAAKEADLVLLSPDPDREGEAIAWHIISILPRGVKYKRVTFNELTKDAVSEAIKHPRDIDLSLVNAQQARRLLDRMVGYKLSPILQRKISRGSKLHSLSAGRVQSVALKLVVDREKEIEAFIPVEYWTLGSFLKRKNEKVEFQAFLHSVDGKKVEKEAVKDKEIFLIPNEEVAKKIQKRLDSATYTVDSLTQKEKIRNPLAPFITSTLQQEAARHYGFSSARTMSIAQSLYEGVDLGDHGTEGLITYMRTDSTRVSTEAENQARTYIQKTFGSSYLPKTAPKYTTKKNAQDAHEAIRPTSAVRTPDSIASYLSKDQLKIYTLIWKRFLSSQMMPAIYDTVSSDIKTNTGLLLRVTGSRVKFPGFLAIYEEKTDSEEEKEKDEKDLPLFKEGEVLSFLRSFSEQSFTKPPARFTEASLIKELEKSGIGRPSTYATIMQKILSREYTIKEKHALKPTELGRIICQMLEENFPHIMNVEFTAEMETNLDKIAEENLDWLAFLKKFWKEFYPTVEIAEKEAKVPRILTDKLCPLCGSKLQKIWSKDKYFLGCSTYPECKYTAPLEEIEINKEEYKEDFDWDQKCPNCGSEMKVRKSRFGIFLGCTNYPQCRGIVNIPKKDELSPEELPSCPAIGCNGKIVQRRSRFGKTFFSCSTFPDCDVIANSLEELKEKYAHHTKTAYVYKRKKAKEKETGTVKKGSSKKKAPSKEKVPRQVGKVMTPSKILSDIIGKDPVTRPQATKKLWDYIKKVGAQDPENRRLIIPDAKLAKFFGSKERIDMMKIASLLSSHLS